MRGFILAGFISLLYGCSTPQMSTDSEIDSESSQNSDPAFLANQNQNRTNILAAQKELSGEILYYLFSADVANQRGQLGLAAALYTKAAEVTNDPRIAQQATRTSYYARNDKLAIKAASLWHKLEPEHLEARQVLAALLVRTGQTEEAVKHFEYVITHGQLGERRGFMLITSMLSKEKDKKAGLAVMQKLLVSRQDNPNALFAYSQLAFLLGELDEAARSIKKVIKLKDNWTEAYILQSNIFTRQGYKAHALVVLKQTISQQEDNKELRMFYARKLVDAKQFSEAAKHFTYLLDEDASNHDARYALGLLSLQMNKPADAKEHFLSLIKSKQRISESQYYLAQALELKSELKQAISWYKKIRHPQYSFEADLRIALIMAKQGHLKKARLRLQNLSPDSLEKELRVYLTEGEILNNAKQYEEAYRLYTEALKQLTGNSSLLYARALTAEKLNKVDQAIEDLEKIIERESANAQALNALGYTLVDKTNKIKKGLGYIQKALKLSPDDAAILDSLGWAYYRLGQYDESLKYLKRAFAKLKDAEIAAHLGEVLWVAGEREKAREILDSALQVAPNDDLLLNVRQRFTE